MFSSINIKKVVGIHRCQPLRFLFLHKLCINVYNHNHSPVRFCIYFRIVCGDPEYMKNYDVYMYVYFNSIIESLSSLTEEETENGKETDDKYTER